ncbi:hypothetical protein ATE84_5121 [Aquimarina sp. MAR_2010_214]|uniref:hypothetical protein n=1 Tax=Aquimarina sp. MAR_2010_214 TaxID=1250026 RepID=UPI000C704A47|nr:hypothetical protein [Aquimarina sp. MAR_2010_214]PKV52988.1 hypothetical protein ATE84_5121 [Aquimarina sp. MAR_2010_214]
MILFYAYGSGLGHLNRILSYIRVREIELSSCIILTNSRHKGFLPQEIKMMYYPDSFFKNHELFFSTLIQSIEKYAVYEFVVDVFPCGFYGELSNLDRIKIKKTIVTRILKTSYFREHSSPRYDDLIILEKGIVLDYYRYSKALYLSINEGFIYSKEKLSLKKPFFFIIHSEPKEEVIQLYKLAQLYQKNDEHIYIQTFSEMITFDVEDVTLIFSERPIRSLLEGSTKIFTACGFNTFFATQDYRQKQHFLPFKRRFDDQFKRKKCNQL